VTTGIAPQLASHIILATSSRDVLVLQVLTGVVIASFTFMIGSVAGKKMIRE